MATIPLYKKSSEGTVLLPASWLGEVSSHTLAQVVRVYSDNKHPGLARVKSRGEVNLTKKKMYRQKHTGNARHGAASAPIFVGGGVTHGPDGVKHVLRLPNSAKRGALKAALSLAVSAKKVSAIDVSEMKKTKDAFSVLSKAPAETYLVVLTRDNWEKAKVFRNISGVTVALVDTINAFEVLKAQAVLFDSNVFPTVAKAKVGKEKKIKK